MQTFLPYSNFEDSVRVLDFRRLNKQVTEAMQLCNVFLRKMGKLQDGKRGWANHPVTKLWTLADGTICLRELIEYTDTCERERKTRPSYRNPHKWTRYREQVLIHAPKNLRQLIWTPDFHLSHRRNLVRKKPTYYIEYFGNIEPLDGYIWEHPSVQ